MQTLLYQQCQMMGRYPYIITRADELAAVEGFEKRQLDNLIEIEVRRTGFNPDTYDKDLSKGLARPGRAGGV